MRDREEEIKSMNYGRWILYVCGCGDLICRAVDFLIVGVRLKSSMFSV